MVFKSKIDTYLLLFILLFPIVFASTIMWATDSKLEIYPLVFIFILLLFIALFLINTKFIIKNGNLVCSVLFFKKTIPLSSITKIEPSNSLLKDTYLKFGCSIKGYYIYYSQYDSIFVSPKNQEQFINELIKQNPNIQLINFDKKNA